MPCRVVTARAGTTAIPAFVRILAAVPTMGEITASFWGAALTLTPGVVPSSSVVLVIVLLARAAHTVRAAGATPPSPVSP